MAFSDILAQTNFIGYSETEVFEIQSAMHWIYGTATGQLMFDAYPGTITFTNTPDTAEADRGTGDIRFDLTYTRAFIYINPQGVAVQEDQLIPIRSITHELVHAVGGLSDNWETYHDFSGDTVSQTNQILSELAATHPPSSAFDPRLSYVAADDGEVLELGRDYANGHHIDRANSTSTNFTSPRDGLNDLLIGYSETANILNAADGDDILFGNIGDDQLFGGAGADKLDGGDGTDRAMYTFSSAAVFVNLSDNKAETGGAAEGDILLNIESIYGSAFDDKLIGDSKNNQLVGEEGADILSGKAGDDELFGDAGNDILRGGEGADSLIGGDDIDTAVYRRSDAAITVNLGDGMAEMGGHAEGDTLSEIENVKGSYFDDMITGDGHDNKLVGLDGDDTLSGAGGDDKLKGQNGNDMLFGNEGDDRLIGGADNDFLSGGTGRDVLVGGEGVDTFFFATGFGRDVIKDFGGDLIQLSVDGINNFEDLMDTAYQISQNTQFYFGNGDKLILKDTDLIGLSADDFQFV